MQAAETMAEEINAAGGVSIVSTSGVREADAWDSVVALSEKRFGIVNIQSDLAGANFRVNFDNQTEEQ